MLYQFLLNFVDTFGFLNVFKYLTFRTGLSVFTSFLIALIIGGPFIKFFSNQKIYNPIRDDGPEDHIIKKIGTPTMGGVIILLGLLVSVLCWADLSNINMLFCIYIAISSSATILLFLVFDYNHAYILIDGNYIFSNFHAFLIYL